MDQRQLSIVLKLQDQATKELQKVIGTLENADQATNSWTASMGKLKTVALGAVTAMSTALVGFVGYGLKIASELETAEIGLSTLLGSTEEARKTVNRLKIEAARTPFELPGLTQATQLLTSVTKDGDKSIDILLNVGEALAAMGKGQSELDRIIVNLQQVASVGKASMIDIKQFAFAGIPIFEMLEEHFKNTGTQSVVNNTKELTKNANQISKLKDQIKVATMQQGEFTKKTKASTKAASEIKLSNLKTELASLESATKSLNAVNGKTVTGFTDISDAIENGQVTFELLTELFDKANDSGGQFFNAYKNQAGSFQQLTSNMKDAFGIFAADFVTKSGIFDSAKFAMKGVADTLSSFDFNKARDEFNSFMISINEKTGLITLMKDAWVFLVEIFNTQLRPAWATLMEAMQPFMPILKDLAGWLGTALVLSIGILVVSLAGLTASLSFLINMLAKGFKVASIGFKAFLDELSDWLVPVINLVDRLANAFDRLLKAAGSAASAVGKTVSNASNSITSTIASKIGARANGGPVSAGNPYIVGERGPELFVPGMSGSIVPNGAMGGGVTVNVYGDVSGNELVAKVTDAITRSLKYTTKIA